MIFCARNGSRLLLILALAGGLGAADDAHSCALAMRLGADSPELVALAATWKDRRGELGLRLKAEDPAERRGAARLLGVIGAGEGLHAKGLVAMLATSPDGEVQRLGAVGLLDHLDGLEPARLLSFTDATLVCRLLARHPAKDVLADAAVRARIVAWLADAERCAMAAQLVAERGALSAWGPELVNVIATASTQPMGAARETLIITAHQTLCVLTRTQRGLDPYASHYALLAKDWGDTLSANRVTAETAPDPELQALVAALPDEQALRTLLMRGPAALSAIEQAMTGADRERRRQLQGGARLLARAVSPVLYEALGIAGLEGMDAEATTERLRALDRAARMVLERNDKRGLVHLLTYLDDRDGAVRGAALDRLVRLSDEKKRFGDNWGIADRSLFPPGQTLWRLRRSLKQGAPDEQVSALQFAASLSATDLGDDVVALLLAPSAMVVETAIETVGHLDLRTQLPVLARIAGDRTQPALRRVKLLDLLGERISRGGSLDAKIGAEVGRILERIIGEETDPLVLAAARKARFHSAPQPAQRRAMIDAMLTMGGGQRAAALRLLADHPSARARDSDGSESGAEVLLADAALPFLFGDERDIAVLAARVFCAAYHDSDHHAALNTLFTAERRKELGDWCGRTAGSWPDHLALAARLGALPRPQLLTAAGALAKDADSDDLWQALIKSAPDVRSALDEVLAAQQAGTVINDHPKYELVTAVLGRAALNRTLLNEVVASGSFDVIRARDNSSSRSGSSSSSSEIARTIPIAGGATLTLKGKRKAGREDDYDDSAVDWTLVPPLPADLPDESAVAALVERLEALTFKEKNMAAYRDLALCLIARRTPDAKLSKTVARHHELWQILALRDPALRTMVATGLAEEGSSYYLREFIIMGNPDLLSAVVVVVTKEQSQWSVERYVPYLASLDAAVLTPHLPALLANQHVRDSPKMRQLMAKLGQMPLSLALDLLKQGETRDYGIAPYGEGQLPALTKALAELKPEAVLPAAPLLRKMREASPDIFAKAMTPLLDRRDRLSAVWLRTNLPFQAGLKTYYAEALTSTVPELWLVGSAIALKEGMLSGHDFLTRLAALPPTISVDASLVATRYLAGKLDGEGALLASIIARTPSAALGTWLALSPADQALIAVLVDRVVVAGDASAIGVALAARLNRDRDTWLPVITAVAAKAGGKLDYLLPADAR